MPPIRLVLADDHEIVRAGLCAISGCCAPGTCPRVDVILVEDPEPERPFGAKGVAEIGLGPTAPAVAAALAAHDGIRRHRLPMRDSPAARAMSVGKAKARPPSP